MFAAEYEPAKGDNGRRAPRTAVSLDGAIARGALDRVLCKVTDISRHGARLQTYSKLKKDSVIRLTLPKIGRVAAKIMWSDDYEAGCQFLHPMHQSAFARLMGEID